MTDTFQMDKYFKTLIKIIAWRAPDLPDTKIIHASAKVPNYVLFRKITEVNMRKMITIHNPRKGTDYTFELDSSWYFWKHYDEKDFEERNTDTDILNTCFEAINTLMVENSVTDPYKISDRIGVTLLDVLFDSKRKEDIHCGIEKM